MRERGCDIMVCDAMVRRYLPAMRAEMVFRLVNRQGMSQSNAAKRLGVSRAAISQYMSKKRGDADISLTDEMNALIDRWAMAVAGLEEGITLCDICRCAMKRTEACRGYEIFSRNRLHDPCLFTFSSGKKEEEEQ